MAADKVVLLETYGSPFAMRAKIALAEKGIEYESKQENLLDKSPLLLEMNPVHKKVPVLIHNGKPIVESTIIVEYIDSVWKDANKSPLLPSDPYLRAQARFWADFVDQKVHEAGRRICQTRGEVQEAAKKDLINAFKVLEGELGEKAYFGGDNFGFVDVSLVTFSTWFYTYEKHGKFSIEEHCPKLVEWAKRCKERESVSKSLADPEKIHDIVLMINKHFGIE